MIILRPYQKEAIQKGIEFFNNPKEKRGAIEVLPTGSGKSIVIAEIAKSLIDPVIVFQPSKEILEQNYAKMLSYGFSDCSIFSASMGVKEISHITFATIGSVRKNPEAFKAFKNVIVDECHFVNSKKGMYKEFFELIGEKILGLTATPYRLTTDGFGGSILKFLTRTRPKIFDKVIYHVQNGELFNDGYLAKLEYKISNNFDSRQLKLNTTGADYTDKSVEDYYERINFSGTIKEIVSKLIGEYQRKNILVFTRFVKEAQKLVEQFPGLCAMVSADSSKKEREDIIKDFKSGKIKIVANVGILTTGFDYPELETVVIARPTRSLALYYQMIGRGIRPHPEKIKTLIVDLCDNYRRFGKVEDLKLVAPSPALWHLESNGKQLTNVYYD